MSDSEFWKPVPGYEGLYNVSTLGRFERVVGLGSRPIAVTISKHNGYPYVRLSKDGVGKNLRAHILVLKAHVGCPTPEAGVEACHLNGIRADIRLDNLMWGTRSENNAHKRLHGTIAGAHKGEKHHLSKVSDQQALEILHRLAAGEKQKDLAAEFGMSQSGISKLRFRSSENANRRAEMRL